ncbi:MAG: RNA polymerase sigma factor [Paracoccaceae bacterium]
MNDPSLTQRLCALSPVLRRSAMRMTRCPYNAEDMAQDTILKLLQRLSKGPEPENLRAYALTTLRNVARSRWRAQYPTDELTEDVAVTQPDAPSRIELAELRQAITHLPPQQARLMTLIAYGETSPAALARETGQPLGTVMSRLSRARATLRQATG